MRPGERGRRGGSSAPSPAVPHVSLVGGQRKQHPCLLDLLEGELVQQVSCDLLSRLAGAVGLCTQHGARLACEAQALEVNEIEAHGRTRLSEVTKRARACTCSISARFLGCSFARVNVWAQLVARDFRGNDLLDGDDVFRRQNLPTVQPAPDVPLSNRLMRELGERSSQCGLTAGGCDGAAKWRQVISFRHRACTILPR